MQHCFVVMLLACRTCPFVALRTHFLPLLPRQPRLLGVAYAVIQSLIVSCLPFLKSQMDSQLGCPLPPELTRTLGVFFVASSTRECRI